MNNLKTSIVLLPIMLIATLWLFTEFIVLHESIRNIIFGTVVFIILVAFSAKKHSYDLKLLMIAILGYSLGGRGFARLGPIEPVYVGEVTLLICFVYMLLRFLSGRNKLELNFLQYSIILLLFYGTAHFVHDFKLYGLVAIRDFSMVYYSLFFFIAYYLFKEERSDDLFKKILKIALLLGIFARVSTWFHLHLFLIYDVSPYFSNLFIPHPDILVPLNVAATIYFSCEGVRKRKLTYLALGMVAAVCVLTGKTAGIVALFACFVLILFYGRIRVLGGILIVTSFVGILLVSVIAIANQDLLVEWYEENDSIASFSISADGRSDAATTDWRLSWWKEVTDMTMEENPMLGLGFGADISTDFAVNYLGIDPNSYQVATFARYPHNIVMTYFGRLGIVGVFVFLIFAWAITVQLVKFCRKRLWTKDYAGCDLIALSFVFAGFVNAFLQATYEAPYGAIPHWVILGYLVTRFNKPMEEVAAL